MSKLSRTINGKTFQVGDEIPDADVQAAYPEFFAGAQAKPFSDEADKFTMSAFFKLDWAGVAGGDSEMDRAIKATAKTGNVLICYGDKYAQRHKGKFFLARTTGMAKARHPEADPAFRICDDEYSWVLSGESFLKV